MPEAMALVDRDKSLQKTASLPLGKPADWIRRCDAADCVP